MANYKSIVDIESVAEATESMNVLVEDAGSLKKVPAGGMIGGGSGNFCFIDGVESETIPKGSAAPSYTYTSTMTYNELVNLINNKELAGVILRFYMTDEIGYLFVNHVFFNSTANEVMLECYDENIYLYYHSDGTINESSNASAS